MKTRLKSDNWLLTRPCAHRGLHGNGVSENSAEAFRRAKEKGYPIELDIQMSTDGELFVIHDENMSRLCGTDVDVRDLNSQEIKDLRLADGQKVPTFKEVLDLVDGVVPLLIEIKQQKQKGVESRAISLLSGYKGEYVIQSFDPFIMLNVKKLAPSVIRGQLGGDVEGQSKKVHFVLKYLPFNFLVRPDFINYRLEDFPLKRSLSRGLPTLGWTVRNEAQLSLAKKHCDSYVFENVTPSAKDN